jgi:hypothetical protein
MHDKPSTSYTDIHALLQNHTSLALIFYWACRRYGGHDSLQCGAAALYLVPTFAVHWDARSFEGLKKILGGTEEEEERRRSYQRRDQGKEEKTSKSFLS